MGKQSIISACSLLASAILWVVDRLPMHGFAQTRQAAAYEILKLSYITIGLTISFVVAACLTILMSLGHVPITVAHLLVSVGLFCLVITALIISATAAAYNLRFSHGDG